LSDNSHIPKESINSRFANEIKSLDSSITDIADVTGISRRTIYDLMKEGGSIKAEYLVDLRENFHIDTEYIITGVRRTAHSQVNQDLEEYHLSIDDEFTRIPYYTGIKAGAGYGIIYEEYKKHYIAFRHYFFKKTLASSAANLLALEISGNSMEPLMQDGDDVLIDRSKRKIKEGPAYLIRVDDEVFVKYLTKLPGGRIKVWSENSHFEPFEVERDNPDFEVIGQVVWHAHVSDYL
jgi:phage repressor protein C with HTH and peptisase S24 domain